MAFEKWFNDYLLKVRSNTHKVNLQKWYSDVYIGELVNYTNSYYAELIEERKIATSPKEILKIEGKMENILIKRQQAEDESKARLIQQFEEQERNYHQKIAKKLARSLMKAIKEPVVEDYDDNQPQQNNRRMNSMTSG